MVEHTFECFDQNGSQTARSIIRGGMFGAFFENCCDIIVWIEGIIVLIFCTMYFIE